MTVSRKKGSNNSVSLKWLNAGPPATVEMTGVPPKTVTLTVFHSLQIGRVPQNKNKSLCYTPHEKCTSDSAH